MKSGDGKISRREWIKRAVVASAVLPSAGGLLSGSPAVARAAAGPKKQLVFVQGTDLTVLDPMMSVSTPTNGALLLIHQGLVFYDKEMKIVPVLATGWSVSPDKKSWTFSLRPNVKFANGARFTAKSIQFAFERMMDPATASPARSLFMAVDRVEAPDDLTVKFITKVPFPDLLLSLAQPNLLAYEPAHTKKLSLKEYARNPMGTGPFMLKEWIPGDRAVFVPNPHFWGPPPGVDSIVIKPVPEGAARAAMLRTGEADIAVELPPEEMRNLEGDPDIVLKKIDSMYQISYELNNTKENPPLANKLVRQALNYAVDKDAIVKTLLMGLGAPMVSPFGPGMGFRATFEPYRYNPEKARKLLAEAGYPHGFKLTLATPSGRYLKDKEVTEAVQGYLQAVGVQAEVRVFEWSPYMTFIHKDEAREAFMVGRATPSPDFTTTRLFSKSAIGLYNAAKFWREKIEELMVKARSSFDAKERTEWYRQIQAIVWEEAPWVFLHNQKALVGTRKNVEGYAMLSTETSVLGGVSKR